jgi:hypothetical protein
MPQQIDGIVLLLLPTFGSLESKRALGLSGPRGQTTSPGNSAELTCRVLQEISEMGVSI